MAAYPAPHSRGFADQRSRPQRCRDAVAELLTLQDEYAGWLAALFGSLRDSTTAEAFQAITNLDLDTLADIAPPKATAATDNPASSTRKPLDPNNTSQTGLSAAPTLTRLERVRHTIFT